MFSARCNYRERIVQKPCSRPACPSWKVGEWTPCSVYFPHKFLLHHLAVVQRARSSGILSRRLVYTKSIMCGLSRRRCQIWVVSSWRTRTTSLPSAVQPRAMSLLENGWLELGMWSRLRRRLNDVLSSAIFSVLWHVDQAYDAALQSVSTASKLWTSLFVGIPLLLRPNNHASKCFSVVTRLRILMVKTFQFGAMYFMGSIRLESMLGDLWKWYSNSPCSLHFRTKKGACEGFSLR